LGVELGRKPLSLSRTPLRRCFAHLFWHLKRNIPCSREVSRHRVFRFIFPASSPITANSLPPCAFGTTNWSRIPSRHDNWR
jgi:hypothetical protein